MFSTQRGRIKRFFLLLFSEYWGCFWYLFSPVSFSHVGIAAFIHSFTLKSGDIYFKRGPHGVEHSNHTCLKIITANNAWRTRQFSPSALLQAPGFVYWSLTKSLETQLQMDPINRFHTVSALHQISSSANNRPLKDSHSSFRSSSTGVGVAVCGWTRQCCCDTLTNNSNRGFISPGEWGTRKVKGQCNVFTTVHRQMMLFLIIHGVFLFKLPF